MKKMGNKVASSSKRSSTSGAAQKVAAGKRPKKTLTEIEALYQLLAENISDVIWIMDLDTRRFRYISPSITRLRGYSVDEAMNQSFEDAVTESSLKNISEAIPIRIQSFLRNEFHSYIDVVEQHCKDGSTVWVEITSRYGKNKKNGHLEVYGVSRNITEHRRAEVELRDKEMRLRRAENIARFGNWELSLNEKIIRASDGAKIIYGFQQSDIPLAEVQRVVLPEYRPVLDTAIKNLIEKNEPYDVEFKIRNVINGNILDIHSKAEYDAQTNKVFGVLHDITERKQVEAALRESEKLNRNLIEKSPLGMHFYRLENDDRLIFVRANSAANTLLGVDHSMFVGKTLEEAFPPLIHTEVPARYRDAAKHGILWSTEQITYADEKITGAFEVRAFQTSPGNVAVVFADITERKRTAHSLQESENRYRELIDLAVDGILIGSHEGIITDSNLSMCVMIGRAKEDILGKHISQFPFTQQSLTNSPFRFDLLQKGEIVVNDRVIVRPDGSEVDVEMRTKMMPDGSYQSIYRDITERKRSEKSLIASESNLQSLINNRNESIWSLDTNYHLIICNEYFKNSYKAAYNIDLTVGIDLISILSPEKKEFWKPKYDAALSGEKISFEFSETILGKLYYFEVSLNPILSAGVITGVSALSIDVSELTRVEQSLRASEERLRLILESLPVAIYATPLDSEYDTTWISGDVKKITGFEIEEYLSKNDFWRQRLHPDDRERVLNEYKKVPTEKEMVIEYRWKCKDGQYHWFHDRSILWQSDSQNEYLGVLVDITDRKYSENLLKESEINYRGLFNTVSDAIYIQDADGKFLDVNAGVEKMYGYTRDEIIGKHPDFLSAPGMNNMDDVTRALNEVRKGTTQQFEFWGKKKNGDIFPKEVRLNMGIYYGKDVTIAVAQDITERKRAEKALVESEEKFRALFENAKDGIFQFTTDGEIVALNESFARMHGYTADEMMKMNFKDLDTPETKQRIPERMQRFLNGESLTFEVEHYCKNGQIIPLEVSANVVTVGGKKYILGFHRDITVRKRAEQALFESSANLEAIIENTSDSIWAINTAYEIIYINDVFEKAYFASFGIHLKPGMNMVDSVPEPIRPLWKSRYDRALGNERFVFEEKIDDGKNVLFIEVSMNPIIAEGKVIGASFFSRNITERKQAELVVAKLKKAIDTSGEAIFLTDNDGFFTYINPGFTALYGYTSDEVLGKETPRILKSNVLNSDVYEQFWKTITSGQEVKGELLNRRKDGSLVAIEGSASPIVDDEKNIVGYLGIQRDITERKRSEEILRESEEKYRSLFNANKDGVSIFYINDDGTVSPIVIANNSAAAMLGYSLEEFLGRHPSDFEVNHSEEKYIARRESLQTKGTSDIEIELKHKTGRNIFVEINAFKIEYNGKPAIMNIIRDITERKKVENKLKESEMRYRELIERIPDGVYKSSHDGKFLEINPAMVKILGYDSMEELLAIDIKTQLYFKDGDRESAALQEEQEEMGVFALKKKDGSEVWVEDHGRHVLDNDGKILFHEGVLRDITERRKAEQAMRQAQKMESIGTLAGGIAHDFNNLLNAVLGQSSLALRKLPKESPAASNIIKAINASERAADLTRQLLAYSGRGKFFIVEIDLNVLVGENVQMLEVSVPKTTQLRYEFGSPSPHISGDISQIQQVIMNLIINAGEAMGPNPGYITIRTGFIDITPASSEYWKYTNVPLTPGRYALLQVSDTGSGISKESLARIFDPFFTTKFTGRGLGLAAVLGIIKGHKGGLRIDSEMGKGTTFEIILPMVVKSAQPNIQEKVVTPVVEGDGKTILIIDDDPFVFELLNDVLTESHFTVIGALEPLKGIEIYEQEHRNIAMVILDYSMPGMDGKSAFELLLKINRDVKVLLCSGYTEEETLSAFGAIRPAGFFQKPYKAQALLERISSMLSIEKR